VRHGTPSMRIKVLPKHPKWKRCNHLHLKMNPKLFMASKCVNILLFRFYSSLALLLFTKNNFDLHWTRFIHTTLQMKVLCHKLCASPWISMSCIQPNMRNQQFKPQLLIIKHIPLVMKNIVCHMKHNMFFMGISFSHLMQIFFPKFWINTNHLVLTCVPTPNENTKCIKKLEFQVCTLEIQKASMKNKDMMFFVFYHYLFYILSLNLKCI
jgi:hypothetical protein